MTLKEILEGSSPLSLDALQRFQGEYDRRFVDDEFTGFGKVRHTFAHMGTLFGRLAKYVQMIEDGHADFSPEEVTQKVIPDLIVYAFWLAGEFGVDIERAYLARALDNMYRLHSDKIPSDELAELETYVCGRFLTQILNR